MASVSAKSARINGMEKDVIDKMSAMKPSDAALAAIKAAGAAQTQAVTDAHMINLTEGFELTFLNNKDWSGNVIGKYPDKVVYDRTNGFTHIGILPQAKEGSEGALVYSGVNYPSGSGDRCAWLLAWHVPIGGSGCKVYVECGPEHNYKPGVINWNIIQQKLNNSPDTSSNSDPDLGIAAAAQINFTGAIGILASTFQVCL